MMIYLALSCLLYFLLLLLPYLVFVNYDGFYRKCKEVNENLDRGADFQFKRFVNIFLVWSMAGVSAGILAFDAILELYVIADYVMGGYSGRKRTLYWVLFWIANGGVVLVCIFYAIFVCVTVCIKGKHDFPVPNIIRILLCCCYEVNSKDSKRSNSAFQFFLALPILLFIQVLAIHGIFVFLALIASPVHVISTIIAYGTGAALIVVMLANLLSSLEPTTPNDSWRSILTINKVFQILGTTVAFFLLLFFVVLFSIVYLRVSLSLGDFDQGGLSSVFAALFPSITFAGIAWIADKVFREYDAERDGSKSSLSQFIETINPMNYITPSNSPNSSTSDPESLSRRATELQNLSIDGSFPKHAAKKYM